MRNKLNQSGRLGRGFTIVELLIVIVVIGILAAITMVAYSGIQTKARDARMHDAAVKVAQAVQILAINQQQIPTMPGWGTVGAVSNGTCTGGGSGGWAGSGTYACALEDMLDNAKLLPNNFMSSLPPNKNIGGSTTGITSLMYYPCYGYANQVLLLYSLESPTGADIANLNSNLSTCSLGTGLRDDYGMRASQIITF